MNVDRMLAALASTVGVMDGGASSVSPRSDGVFTLMLLATGAVALTLFVLVVFFSLRWRHGARRDRRNAPTSNLKLEVGWSLGTLAVFLVMCWGAARAYVALAQTPPDAMPVHVVAKQWMWKAQHRNGRREINQLHVPLGQPVRLVLTSQDVIHSFFVPAFRVKRDVVPGRYTTLWFRATQLGEFPLRCAEYCGTEHSHMTGRIVVMPPAEFARWLSGGVQQPGLAQDGFRFFRTFGCSGCHSVRSTVNAPLLDGLIGRTVHLRDGRTIVADENYIRDSILLPSKDIVAGYKDDMPSFSGQVDEEQVRALIEYIRSTGSAR